MRTSEQRLDKYHPGRGGQGNVHKVSYGGHGGTERGHENLGAKVKSLFGKETEREESPLMQPEAAE